MKFPTLKAGVITAIFCSIGNTYAAEIKFSVYIFYGESLGVSSGIFSSEATKETFKSLAVRKEVNLIKMPSPTCSETKPTEIALTRESNYGINDIHLKRSTGIVFTSYPSGSTWVFSLLFSSPSQDQKKLLNPSKYFFSDEESHKTPDYEQSSPGLRSASISTEEVLIEGNPSPGQSLILSNNNRLIVISREL